ncbi:exonuclease domain-containing protein [Corynebacterium liangguodongii]|uniref:exonuclease domain-containing protein n=1 Tax=Corynebacterium liangguodongii TaxID=2079535 RepID=UPI001F295B4F|nr:exonuclease domain-containing protein [Corynebacterium liangguodongii]
MDHDHSAPTVRAHGLLIEPGPGSLVIRRAPLAAALEGAGQWDIAAEEIESIFATEGDEWAGPACTIAHTGGRTTVRFHPGDEAGPRRLAELVERMRAGGGQSVEPPASGRAVASLNFVGFDVETANPSWGSICQMGLVKIIDGREVERASWLCTPPPGLDEFDPNNVAIHGITADDVADAPPVGERIAQFKEFVGDLPIVAHNAQFDATALREASLATGTKVPTVLFACSLAQSRAAKLKVKNHRLNTLAEHFGVPLEHHHDAAEDAAACAGIMVGLTRAAGYEGSLMGFVHSTGFTLGAISDERVIPVLRDRSGAGRAMQAKLAQSGAKAAADGAAAPRGSNQQDSASPSGKGRGPAPWQSVATPDTVPEPHPDADPAAELYGQHVTLTGDFEPHDKGELWAGIAQQGGQVGKNVTKKTTILVTGEWATMTSKEKRARELIGKGQDIEIWPASRLYTALGLADSQGSDLGDPAEEPPF